MTTITTTPRTGTFAGRFVETNREGQGVFTRMSDGTLVQHAGTGQTPTFKSSKQLAAYLHRHFDY
jgi:hypothetical protein